MLRPHHSSLSRGGCTADPSETPDVYVMYILCVCICLCVCVCACVCVCVWVCVWVCGAPGHQCAILDRILRPSRLRPPPSATAEASADTKHEATPGAAVGASGGADGFQPPTEAPTEAPTEVPTEAPTEVQNEAPLNASQRLAVELSLADDAVVLVQVARGLCMSL